MKALPMVFGMFLISMAIYLLGLFAIQLMLLLKIIALLVLFFTVYVFTKHEFEFVPIDLLIIVMTGLVTLLSFGDLIGLQLPVFLQPMVAFAMLFLGILLIVKYKG